MTDPADDARLDEHLRRYFAGEIERAGRDLERGLGALPRRPASALLRVVGTVLTLLVAIAIAVPVVGVLVSSRSAPSVPTVAPSVPAVAASVPVVAASVPVESTGSPASPSAGADSPAPSPSRSPSSATYLGVACDVRGTAGARRRRDHASYRRHARGVAVPRRGLAHLCRGRLLRPARLPAPADGARLAPAARAWCGTSRWCLSAYHPGPVRRSGWREDCDKRGGRVTGDAGELSCAEVEIVKRLRRAGWDAAWVSAFGRGERRWGAYRARPSALSQWVRDFEARLGLGASGRPDVVAWTHDMLVYIEAKARPMP